MRLWVGFDVAKAFLWMCVLDEEGDEVLCRRVEATEQGIDEALDELDGLGGERVVGIDMVGGPATLLETMLLERHQSVFYVSGMAVNRAREAYVRARASLGSLLFL